MPPSPTRRHGRAGGDRRSRWSFVGEIRTRSDRVFHVTRLAVAVVIGADLLGLTISLPA
ncbi:hypothetical protein [Propylenella binzhouense]|uniref:hypothetical protein n=1 Tax=Propylenella binzhouense TaxID=2555902 RepID=UPI00136A483D|nr:hypothetical protein [Propylenella binzhouense]